MPQIDSASQIFATSPTQLQIEGSGFGSLRPTVVLGGTPLFLLSFTDTLVFASVPVAARRVPQDRKVPRACLVPPALIWSRLL
jgi:hypothetical protein